MIDATAWHRPLRKNLGKKNCELGEEDIQRICDTFLAFEVSEQSKIFDNDAFGYWKATVDRPLRLNGIDPNRAYKAAEIKKMKESCGRSETAPARHQEDPQKRYGGRPHAGSIGCADTQIDAGQANRSSRRLSRRETKAQGRAMPCISLRRPWPGSMFWQGGMPAQ